MPIPSKIGLNLLIQAKMAAFQVIIKHGAPSREVEF